ncbi:LysR family transcriptional regulator [Sphingomonas hankookensis]|uniref:LysR family transcriptional regulator n=1 Tax=Sphingomonas hankookensis TaxID=563996 RepID=UPI003D30296A
MTTEPILRRLNLNLLYALDALLRAPTLTAAGRSISLTQPAMSMALRRLRAQFGDELVVFAHGESRRTELGDALRPRVARILREADDAFNLRLAFDPQTARRTVTIAAPEAVELMFLRLVVPALLAAGPGLDVRLMPFHYGSSEALFDRGVDIALVPAPMVDPRHPSRPLFDHGLSGVVWRENRRFGAELSMQEYREAWHVALFDDMEPAHQAGTTEGPDADGKYRNVKVRTGLYSMLPNLVVGTDLVATMSSWLAQHYATMIPIRLVGVPVRSPMSTVVAQWPAHRANEPYIHWLLALLETAVDWPGGACRPEYQSY